MKTIHEYIQGYPEDVQEILQKIRDIILHEAPNAVETFSYGIPTFDLNGKHLIHFAVYKNHIGIYPSPSGVEAFKNDLSDYKFSKGAIQFLLNKPFPYDLLKRIVAFRVSENR